jgi:hypothetical protein
MNRSLWIIYGCIIFASVGLAVGFALGGQEWYVPVVALLGITWLVAVQRDWGGVKTTAMVVFAAGAAFAAWKGFAPGLMLLVLLADLSAWDLLSMMVRFKRIKREALEPQIEARHLIRLAVVDGIGLLLGSAGMLMKINLNLGIEILLTLLAAFALSQLILHLRRSGG